MARGTVTIGGVEYVIGLPSKRRVPKPAVCPICRKRIRADTPHTGNAQRGKAFRWLHGSHSTKRYPAFAHPKAKKSTKGKQGEAK